MSGAGRPEGAGPQAAELGTAGPQARDGWARTLRRLLVAALAVAALVGACRRNEVARFPHQNHLGMACGGPGQPQCLTCLSCHGDIVKSAELGHASGEDCGACHEEDSRGIRAVLSAPPTPEGKLAATIGFDHELHLAMEEFSGQCIHCHSGVVSDDGGANFPPMSSCFECHEHQEQWDRGVCAPCHQKSDLKNLFPRTYLRHGPGWDIEHGVAASNTTVQCAQCHTTESCDDCHDVSQGMRIEVRQATQIEKDFVHPADFITRHAMEAESQPARCLSCHRTETCQSCHLARGVSADRIGAINPHPPGWTGPDAMDPRHHGRAARRDILSCASCHDQGPDTNCIDCHRVGGPGGNPHPEGWRSTRTPDEIMCSYCHEGQR